MASGYINLLEVIGLWVHKANLIFSNVHFFANDKKSSFFSGYRNSSFFADDKKSSFEPSFKRSSFEDHKVIDNG